MGGLRAVVLVFAAAFVAVLLASSLSSAASAGTVKIYYQDVKGIQVDFPNGNEIKAGVDLIITTSSDVYDMERSGIMFYECGPDGTPDMTTTVTPYHYSLSEGNVVTHVFRNLTTDIRMNFTELKELGTQNTAPSEPAGKKEIFAGGDPLTTAIMLAATVLGAVMLAIMTQIIRMLDSIPNEPERA